jgi:hypothetical protein
VFIDTVTLQPLSAQQGPTQSYPGPKPQQDGQYIMDLINELYEAIERDPPALEARKLLTQQLIQQGWYEAAVDNAREILKIDPYDEDAQDCVLMYDTDSGPSSSATGTTHQTRLPFRASPITDVTISQEELKQGYEDLRKRASVLHREARLLRNLEQQKGIVPPRCEKYIPDLQSLVEGRIRSLFRVSPPGSARAVARAMEAKPDKALEVAVTDLSDIARWLRSQGPSDNDSVREALVKRVRVLTAALPNELQPHASTALMHIEHELLQRTYLNDETMLGDPVSDIPRANFWVSEDGYAWDMEELSNALASNRGVMRNPLSKQLFTPKDINAIIKHPLGKRLAAMRVEQSQMSKGVRPTTIAELDKLAAALLADQSADQIPSRQAVDEFSAYMATLPQAEQKALNELRVPATDSHTGQPFDTTIGDAVRDAQGNRVCFHKTGDLIRQAASHLRQRR